MQLNRYQLSSRTVLWVKRLALIAAGVLLTACSYLGDDSDSKSTPAIAAGFHHTCALTSAGGVKCWGRNWAGQLGSGTTADSSTPVDVIGLSSGVSAIGARSYHACALTIAGGVKCWGNNDRGQLGNGTTTNSASPTDVVGLGSGVIAISVGGFHTCAITGAGAVKCWGQNYDSELGNGTTVDASVPTDVIGLSSGASALSAGWQHTCALTSAGGLKCWGSNGFGQLGNGTTTNSAVPTDVIGLSSGVSAISAGGMHMCALTSAGRAKCWGDNGYRQLGDGTASQRAIPTDVIGLSSGVSAISAGAYGHSCALTNTGGVKCWGLNDLGQLGNGTTTTSGTPMGVIGLSSGVSAISAGGFHTCALTRVGSAKCWGYGVYGELGNGADVNYAIPVVVGGLSSGVSAVSAGNSHACALTSAGGVKCWGSNGQRQLGNGTVSDSGTPVDVIGLNSGVSSSDAGASHSCALTSAGGVKCWGYNGNRQLGNGTASDSAIPTDVIGLGSGVSVVSVGGYHTCALTGAGGVKCWGSNFAGQLGNGTTSDTGTPEDVIGLSRDVSAVSAGGQHTCALTGAGGVKCWGSNSSSQLGNGTTTNGAVQTDVIGLSSGVSAVSAGGYHTCALTSAGGVKCWGDNAVGQLGNGTTSGSATPVDVIDLSSGVSAVSAGWAHTCAITVLGGVKCWGSNGAGELGTGTRGGSLTPTDVSGLSSGVGAISAGSGQTCALTRAGGVKCWGIGDNGLMGHGGISYTPSPVDVVDLVI